MPFRLSAEHPIDERGLSPHQDPDLRAAVMPLFSFDRSSPENRPQGWGTTFRIDPWDNCATAFHVIEDTLQVNGDDALGLIPERGLCALEMEGIQGYGVAPLPQDAWRPVRSIGAICGIERPPFASPRIRNTTELAEAYVPRSEGACGPTPFLPVDLSHWHPEPGQIVVAFGYADLDVDDDEEGDDRPLSQYIYRSEARIIDVQRPDGSSGRPWPVFRVDADWPAGMSGGPVFNESHHVIGIVSTGIASAGVGSAVYFSAWNLPEQIFKRLDNCNPGRFRCWGNITAAGYLTDIGQDRSKLQDPVNARWISANPATGEYLML